MIFKISAPSARSPRAHQLIEGELVLLEFADGEGSAVDREWWTDDVDTRAVGEASVADRRGLVDAAADLTDDALTNIHQLSFVTKTNIRQLDLAATSM